MFSKSSTNRQIIMNRSIVFISCVKNDTHQSSPVSHYSLVKFQKLGEKFHLPDEKFDCRLSANCDPSWDTSLAAMWPLLYTNRLLWILIYENACNTQITTLLWKNLRIFHFIIMILKRVLKFSKFSAVIIFFFCEVGP